MTKFNDKSSPSWTCYRKWTNHFCHCKGKIRDLVRNHFGYSKIKTFQRHENKTSSVIKCYPFFDPGIRNDSWHTILPRRGGKILESWILDSLGLGLNTEVEQGPIRKLYVLDSEHCNHSAYVSPLVITPLPPTAAPQAHCYIRQLWQSSNPIAAHYVVMWELWFLEQIEVPKLRSCVVWACPSRNSRYVENRPKH